MIRCQDTQDTQDTQDAALEAEAKVQQAEGPARAKIERALVEADAKIQAAEGPAKAKILQALVEADEKLLEAEAPARAKILDAAIVAKDVIQVALVEAETKLRQAQQELTYQHDVFDRFFALSLDMMCISSSEGYFTRVSSSFAALGYSQEELLSRPYLELVHPDDKATTLAQHEKLRSGTASVSFENRFRCKDGSYRWLAWVSGPDTAGVLYSMARDVSETKRVQEELARAKNTAEAMNRELESFSYSVAHDLRAPLRSIDGFSQSLLEDCGEKLDTECKRYLSVIRESAQRMAHLIDDLLGLSRVTRTELRREVVDLSTLARAANARIQSSLPERCVHVVIQDGLCGEADPHLLTVVLDNLLGNAWKFTNKRADARIQFGASSKDGELVYFVRDNGAGFDMAFAGKLFGVFQRLHHSTEFEGTGVGLATVQRVVQRHGGRIWAEAEVNAGATFYFTLHEARRLT